MFSMEAVTMVFKCKMCGGDIEVVEGSNIGKCLYCKSTMTLPSVDNEKLLNLYNRANNLRLSNEFDKAYGVYETILEIDENQLEALHQGDTVTVTVQRKGGNEYKELEYQVNVGAR